MVGFKENLDWFPRYQRYLREHQPPSDAHLLGPQGMATCRKASGRAYLCNLPQAEFHVLDGSYWALETDLDEIAARMCDFLGRTSLPDFA
jgi:hypothetical protein